MRFHIPTVESAEDDPVETFQTNVMNKASVISASDAIAIFREIHCLTPRGRYDIKQHGKDNKGGYKDVDFGDSDNENEPDAYLARVKAEAREKDYDDDDDGSEEESTDEDFNPTGDVSDVAEEYDSNAASDWTILMPVIRVAPMDRAVKRNIKTQKEKEKKKERKGNLNRSKSDKKKKTSDDEDEEEEEEEEASASEEETEEEDEASD
ncbi:FACT complex subunit Ssrp1 [Eumeta japonica]|uniref:FACT complex subunit Ssrp1 n=1 Tax=Eumeta variegata TaxID=151549 RepID=A0A4C1SNC9_EUMVA|nr:FACT complex subunit Ssrp1 [Eumeta japonica]